MASEVDQQSFCGGGAIRSRLGFWITFSWIGEDGFARAVCTEVQLAPCPSTSTEVWVNKSAPAPGEEACDKCVCARIHTVCPWKWPQAEAWAQPGGRGDRWHRTSVPHSRVCRPHGDVCSGAPTRPPPLSPSPRGSISARGAHVMGMLPGEVRPGIQSFPDFTLCLHPDIPAWHWSHRWPGRRFPGQTRGLQAQAGSQCVATCQARCQAGQDLHSKAAGWPANLDPEIIELPLIEHCQCGMQIRSPGFPLRQGNNFRIVFDTN